MKKKLFCLLITVAMILSALPVAAGATDEVQIHDAITIAHPLNPDAVFTLTNVADICTYTLRTDNFWALDVFFTPESTLSTNYYYLMAEHEFENADTYFEWFLWPEELPEWATELPEGMNVNIDVVLEPGTEVSIDEYAVFHSGDGSLWHLGQPGSFFINFRSIEFMQDTLESFRTGHDALHANYERQLTEFAVSGVVGGNEQDEQDEQEPDDTEDSVDSGAPVDLSDLLDGAHASLVEELALALELGFVPEAMIGNWREPTSRLLAAEMIVMLVEVVLEMDIDEIAEELDLDMSDTFSDTDSIAATFLKATGISTGVDDVRYDPGGKFTRVMMVTMLGRLAENVFRIDLSGYQLGTDVFTDLPAAGYGYANQYVGWAAETGITLGDGASDRFAPANDLINQATVAFTFRAYAVISGSFE